MKKRWALFSTIVISFLLVNNIGAFTTSTNSVEVNVNNHFNDKIENTTKKIENDVVTNLLRGANNEDLETISNNGIPYKLKKIDLTRYRQKIKIEYYLGDYTASTFIGSDEGYADYDDSIRSYVKSINKVNEDFNQSIPSTYKFVAHPDSEVSVQSYVPRYSGKDTLNVKVLIAEVKKVSVVATKYQNRQGIVNPSPFNMSTTDLTNSTNFWKVNTLSTSFSGIVGQQIDLKSISQFTATYSAGSRTGNLNHYGMHDITSGLLTNQTTYTISNSNPTTINLSATYEVEDYDQPESKPSYSSSMTTGGSVGFGGLSEEWKTSTSTETMDLSNSENLAKLQAYPFNLDDDPFDNPEHVLYYVPDNWFLGHKIELSYYYESSEVPVSLYTVTFNSNGGSKVDNIINVKSDSLIRQPSNPTKKGYKFNGWYIDKSLKTKWNFNKDKVNSNMTLFAKWTKTSTESKKDDLASTGANSIYFLSSLLAISGLAMIVYRKKHM